MVIGAFSPQSRVVSPKSEGGNFFAIFLALRRSRVFASVFLHFACLRFRLLGFQGGFCLLFVFVCVCFCSCSAVRVVRRLDLARRGDAISGIRLVVRRGG